jgi:ADP-ribosylglycohydrolase
MEQDKKSIFDKIKGMFIGGALGDALGAPHEFFRYKSIKGIEYPEFKYTGKLEYPIERFNRFKQKFEKLGEIGTVTDDTEMTWVLVNHLILNNGKFDEDKLILSYLKWANSRGKFMGKNTRSLFKGIKTIKGYKNRYEKQFPNKEITENAQSNGSLMRCATFAIFKNFENLAIQDCKLTNPSNFTIKVETIYLNIIRNILLQSQSKLNKDQIKKQIKEYLIKLIDENVNDIIIHGNNISNYGLNLRIKSALDGIVLPVIENKGWCLHGLYCTIFALFNFSNYFDAINWVIHQGGDTDTNADIAGFVLGALYGYQEMITEKITKENVDILLNINNYLNDDTIYKQLSDALEQNL